MGFLLRSRDIGVNEQNSSLFVSVSLCLCGEGFYEWLSLITRYA